MMKKIISKRLNLVIKVEIQSSIRGNYCPCSSPLLKFQNGSRNSLAAVIPPKPTSFHLQTFTQCQRATGPRPSNGEEILQNSLASSDLSTSLFPETYMVSSLMRRQSDSSVRSPILPSIPQKMSHQQRTAFVLSGQISPVQ